jgi:hypothetical protein
LRIVPELVEWDELHIVSRLEISRDRRLQRLLVCIKRLHYSKLSLTNADDDDGERILGGLDQLVVSLDHVKDLSICQYDQDVVPLVVLALLVLSGGTVPIYSLEHLGEVSWPEEVALFDGVSVGLDATINAVHLWRVDVTSEREAMGYFHLLRKLSSETVYWILFVGVVILQDQT